jgi:hypothetical protein
LRFLAFIAPHPRLRTGVASIAVMAMLGGGGRLWTSVPPDAVHITITHLNFDENRLVSATVIGDCTIRNSAVAERLQRDLAALKLFGLFDSTSGPTGSYDSHNTYTLTWYWAGLPVEYAHEDRTGCGFWHDDLVLTHWSVDDEALMADINAAVAK